MFPEGSHGIFRTMVAEEDLRALPKKEKFRIMEILWRDLSCTDSNIPSPQWHAEALESASDLHAKGRAVFLDWNEAKARIRKAAL